MLLAIVSCALGLNACTGTTFTTWPGGGKVEFSDLNETTDDLLELSFSSIVMNVQLESGSVDIEVVDASVFADDSNNYVELDTVFAAEGLVDGDTVSCQDDDGDVVVRITGHDATGTITLSEG